MAGIAGYVDAACFSHYHAFAGQMTGNTVLLAIDIATLDWGRAAEHLAIIAAFLAGVLAATVAGRRFASPGAVLLGSAVIVALCSLISSWVAAAVLAVAMGLQNAAARRFGAATINTTFITGDMQKMVGSLSDRHADLETRWTGRLLLVLIFAYLAGAVLGAVMSELLRYPLLIPPTLMLVALGDAFFPRKQLG